jgi:hypothetical protein
MTAPNSELHALAERLRAVILDDVVWGKSPTREVPVPLLVEVVEALAAFSTQQQGWSVLVAVVDGLDTPVVGDALDAIATTTGERVVSEQLKPCPFCGGEATHSTSGREVECTDCNVELRATTPKGAAHAWNRRAAPGPLTSEERERLADSLMETADHCWAERDGDIMNGETPERTAMWERRALDCEQAAQIVRAAGGERIDSGLDIIGALLWKLGPVTLTKADILRAEASDLYRENDPAGGIRLYVR